MLVCSDTHTGSGGAFNCAARGVGGPDIIYAAIKAETWFRVYPTIRYDIEGKLAPGVTAKDVFLYLANTYGDHAGHNIEFGGPGMSGLRIDARRTIAAMCTELNAEFAIFEADDLVIDHVRKRNPAPFTPTDPDADARYAARRTLDLSQIEILVAKPDTLLNNAVPVREVAGTAINQGFIGSCANGNLDDLEIAARVLAGTPRRARRAPARHARLAGGVPPGAQGRLHRDLHGGRRGRHQPDLRRLQRRPHGPARRQRDLHHRQHPQQQGPHGRSERAHLHGIAGDGRGVRRDRRHHRSGRISPRCLLPKVAS